MKKIIVGILIVLTISVKAQDSTATAKVVDTANNFLSVQLSQYVQTNFKCLTIQQVEDFLKFVNQNLGQVKRYYTGELEKKKKK